LPSEGYTKIFENMIMNNELIDVRLGVDYFKVSDMKKISHSWLE